jgi:hypothetical protein
MTYPKDTGKYVLAIVVLLVALIIISTLSL